MRYYPDPANPNFWFYDGLRIQADVEAHHFAVEYAKAHFHDHSEVLDIAAGEGALTKQLLDIGFQVSCTSWNERSNVAVPTYHLNLDNPFAVQDVGDHQYSLVCCIEAIEHIENPSCLLRSCRSIMAPGSRLLLSTPNVESAVARIQWLIHGCPSIFQVEEVRQNRHISMQWRQGLEFLIERSGFTILEKHLLGSFRFPRTPLSLVKKVVTRAMQKFLKGDLYGTTRLYVLGLSNETSPGESPSRFY